MSKQIINTTGQYKRQKKTALYYRSENNLWYELAADSLRSRPKEYEKLHQMITKKTKRFQQGVDHSTEEFYFTNASKLLALILKGVATC
jgi:hypothetical protein